MSNRRTNWPKTTYYIPTSFWFQQDKFTGITIGVYLITYVRYFHYRKEDSCSSATTAILIHICDQLREPCPAICINRALFIINKMPINSSSFSVEPPQRIRWICFEASNKANHFCTKSQHSRIQRILLWMMNEWHGLYLSAFLSPKIEGKLLYSCYAVLFDFISIHFFLPLNNRQ